MSFSDTVFLFFLALILFGPKKLPEMARQAGRLLAELRRASNEFRSQIETEIAHLETEKTRTLPPSPPQQGTLASLDPSPAAGVPAPLPLESPAPSAETALAAPMPVTSSSLPPTGEAVADPQGSTAQESHA